MTEAGRELGPVIDAIGAWGQRWIETEATLKNLDPVLLMWDIRRNIDVSPMPRRRNVIQFIFEDLTEPRRNWWLVVAPAEGVDLCGVDPGHDVDLYLSTDLRTMTEIWMGYTPMTRALEERRLILTGCAELQKQMQSWLKLNPLAAIPRKVA